MSPIVEKEGHFHLDRAEKIKLYVVWLSCTNFGALSETINIGFLKEAWGTVKDELRTYFRNYCITIDSITGAFRKINLTIDPNLPCGYDPEKDILIFNLWTLFFSLTQDGFVTPTPAWQTAGSLIHEYDHYVFLRDCGMIGGTEDECKHFSKENLSKLEKRAFSSQIAFFEKCKEKVPPKQRSYRLRKLKWTSDGKHIDGEIPVFDVTGNAIKDSISEAIRQIQEVIRRIEMGESYEDFSTQNSIEESLKMVDLLSLPIVLDKTKKDYPKVEIEM